MPRVLHLGNIANNGYNNAKHLNKSSEIQHFALNFDNPHVMAAPQWEEIDTHRKIDEFNPEWLPSDPQPPSWYRYLETSTIGEIRFIAILSHWVTIRKRRLAYWLKDQGLKKQGRRIQLPASLTGKLLAAAVAPVFTVLYAIQLLLLKIELRTQANKGTDQMELLSNKLAAEIRDFDLIEAYGSDVIIPYLLNIPYVAYEHGTLRELPFENSRRGELLSEAYRAAEHTFITNPDVHDQARKLGLQNVSFVPHVVDHDRFCPGDADILRKKFDISDEFVVLAPARQNWEIKGNDKIIKGFADFVSQHGNAVLLLCDWGQHRDLTKKLVYDLSLSERVLYYPPVPKLTSVKYYRLADVVIDQVNAGTFGGITPEAMACGKPTLVNYHEADHEWCFSSHPPVQNVRTEADISSVLRKLAEDSGLRSEIGRRSRIWMKNEYSIGRMTAEHDSVFNSIFERGDK